MIVLGLCCYVVHKKSVWISNPFTGSGTSCILQTHTGDGQFIMQQDGSSFPPK